MCLMKSVPAIIQARMSSHRLPGKTLAPIAGKPMLERVVDRVRLCRRLNLIMIATSRAPEDDAVEAFCVQGGVVCYRGSLENVAERFLGAANKSKTDGLMRISADSPLIDPHIMDRAMDLYEQQPADLVTNVPPRTFPRGQSVEILHRETFVQTFSKMQAPYD